MADPTLSRAFSDVYKEIAYYLGWTRSPDAGNTVSAKLYANAGYRRFLDGVHPKTGEAHEWSFLHPPATLTTFGSVTDTISGQGSYSAPTTGLTGTDSVFTAGMVGGSVRFDTSGNMYVIATHTNATTISVYGDASGESSGDTVVVYCTGLILPDDFGGIIGDIAYSGEDQNKRIFRTDANTIASWMAGTGTTPPTGPPSHYAVDPVLTQLATTGQRYRALFWFVPDTAYRLNYRYNVNPDALVTDGHHWYGSAMYSHVIEQLGMAVAEQRERKTIGPMSRLADDLLAGAIQRDAVLLGVGNLGYNGNGPSDVDIQHIRNPVTVSSS